MSKPTKKHKFDRMNFAKLFILPFLLILIMGMIPADEGLGFGEIIEITVTRGETPFQKLVSDSYFLSGLAFLVVCVAYVSYDFLKGGGR